MLPCSSLFWSVLSSFSLGGCAALSLTPLGGDAFPVKLLKRLELISRHTLLHIREGWERFSTYNMKKGWREYSSTTPDKCEEGSTIPKEGITHKERGNAQSPYMRRSSAPSGKLSGTHHEGGGRTEALPTSNRQPRVYEIDIFKSMREHERNKTHQCLIFAHMFSKIFLYQEIFVEWPEGQLFREGW